MAWLPGFRKRIPFAIDHNDIDSPLDWFAVRLHLSAGETEEQTSSNTAYPLYSGYKTRVGQRLTISNRRVYTLAFNLYDVGSPSGDVTFTIRQLDDTILASKVWGDAGDMGIPGGEKEVTLDTPVLVNEEVRLCCEYSGAGNTLNAVYVRFQNTDVKASEGLSYYDGSWTDEDGNGNDYDVRYKYTYNDISCIFDEVGANSKKIAITKSDGITELYGEIEKWDEVNEEAELWVSRDGWAISDSEDTVGYLYYDNTHADNDAYIGIKNSTPAQNVWDGNFKGVYHMADGVDNEHIYDSTSNNNDGTKKAANEPIEASGKIADAQDFDGDDYIDVDDIGVGEGTTFTLEGWLKTSDTGAWGTLYAEANLANQIQEILLRKSAGNHAIIYVKNDAAQPDSIEGTVIVTDNAWHYLAGTRDGADLAIFTDGGDKQTVGGVAGTWTLDISALGVIHRSNFLQYLIGSADEIRVSDVTRTDAWIKASYESGRDDLITWGSRESLLSPSSIDSTEAFGTNKVNLGVSPNAISSLEAFGTSKLNLKVTPSAIASLEAFGDTKLNLKILASAIISLEAFGTAKLSLRIFASAISSLEAFGSPKVNLRILASAISSLESFGTAKINQRIKAVAIASAEAFGNATLLVVGRVLKVKVVTSLYRKIRIGTR